MSKLSEKWIISEEHKKMMSSFMSDMWKVIKASYEFPADDDPGHDHYWSTLIKWADALGKKYDCDPVIRRMIIGYIDGQSIRATGRSEDEDSTNITGEIKMPAG